VLTIVLESGRAMRFAVAAVVTLTAQAKLSVFVKMYGVAKFKTPKSKNPSRYSNPLLKLWMQGLNHIGGSSQDSS